MVSIDNRYHDKVDISCISDSNFDFPDNFSLDSPLTSASDTPFPQRKITPWSPLNRPQEDPNILELEWDSSMGEQVRKVASLAALKGRSFSSPKCSSSESVVDNKFHDAFLPLDLDNFNSFSLSQASDAPADLPSSKKTTSWSPLNGPQQDPNIPELEWESPMGEQVRKVASHAALECRRFSRERRGSHEMIVAAIDLTRSQKKTEKGRRRYSPRSRSISVKARRRNTVTNRHKIPNPLGDVEALRMWADTLRKERVASLFITLGGLEGHRLQIQNELNRVQKERIRSRKHRTALKHELKKIYSSVEKAFRGAKFTPHAIKATLDSIWSEIDPTPDCFLSFPIINRKFVIKVS